MNFTVRFKVPTGRAFKLNCIADNFETCLEKISALYGKNLISITYETQKNPINQMDSFLEVEKYAVSREKRA